MTDGRFDQLLASALDGQASDAENQELADRLRESQEARRQYLHYVALHSSLHWEYAGEALASEREPSGKRPSRAGQLALTLGALAAGIVLLATLLFRPTPTPPPSLATVEFASGAALQTQARPSELETGQRIPAGTINIESASGAIQLRFDDQTLMTLNGAGSIAISESDAGKQIDLNQGRLTANVSEQPRDCPLRIVTAVAEIEVLGTTLSVQAGDESTTLKVENGLVRFRRLTDGKTVDVPAGYGVNASLKTDGGLGLTKFGAPASDWELAPGEVRGITKGSSKTVGEETFFEAEPYIAGRGADGMTIVRNGVAVNGHLVRLTGQSVVQLRYRSGSTPTLFLTTQRPDGDFGGNFEFRQDADEPLANADGWRIIEARISDFEPAAEQRRQSFRPDENTVTKILISVHDQNPLDVANLSVTTQP